MNLSEKLVFLRKQKGLTQIELAEKLNVSRQAVSRWEVGTAVPGTDNLKVLSDLYSVSIDYLLHDHADDSLKTQEIQEAQPNEFCALLHNKMHLVIIALGLILAIVIVICTTVVQLQKEEDNPVIPISEMNHEEVNDDYPTYTFSFD